VACSDWWKKFSLNPRAGSLGSVKWYALNSLTWNVLLGQFFFSRSHLSQGSLIAT
jgi:hypothetical protein